MKKAIFLILPFLFLISCATFKKNEKDELTNGYYKQKIGKEKRKIYLQLAEDTMKIYPTSSFKNEIDTTNYDIFYPEMKSSKKINFYLKKRNLDLDILTIPIKFRFAQKGVPAQLSSTLNGVIYVGSRKDVYHFNYHQNPIKKSVRNSQHFGYSFGVFTGVGNTFMSPTTTLFRIEQEYDGLVWSKGLAGFIAINHFNIGLTIGFDNLLDKNRKIWIYENRPWIGIGVGIDLN